MGLSGLKANKSFLKKKFGLIVVIPESFESAILPYFNLLILEFLVLTSCEPLLASSLALSLSCHYMLIFIFIFFTSAASFQKQMRWNIKLHLTFFIIIIFSCTSIHPNPDFFDSVFLCSVNIWLNSNNLLIIYFLDSWF